MKFACFQNHSTTNLCEISFDKEMERNVISEISKWFISELIKRGMENISDPKQTSIYKNNFPIRDGPRQWTLRVVSHLWN